MDPELNTQQAAGNPSGAGAATSTAAAPTTPAASTSTGSVPSPGAAGMGNAGVAGAASGAGGAGASAIPAAGTTTTTQAQQAASVRDVLRQMGVDLGSQHQDDYSALQALAGAYRQNSDLRQLAQHGQTYLQHADQFQAFIRQQQEENARKQAQQTQWWKAPEYDPSWQSKIFRDQQSGELRVLPGNDPAILSKYQAWVDHQRGFMDRFSRDPIEAIKPGIEQVAQQVAQQMIQQHLGSYREQQIAQSVIQKNANWIYETAPSGQQVLSQWGQKYAQYVQQAQRFGIGGTAQQDEYAVSMVQRDYAMSQIGQQQQAQSAQAQGDAAKNTFLQNAARTQPAGAAGVNPGVNPTAVAATPVRTQRDLQSLMLAKMQEAGFQPHTQIDLTR